MHILLMNQFYPPDTAPTGQFLHDLARALVSRGHTVTVLCASRAYQGRARYPAAETVDGVRVRRVWTPGRGRGSSVSRILDATAFFVAATWQALRVQPRPDFCLCLTSPPFVGLIGVVVGALRGVRQGHWLMDLYPDVMVAHGMLSARSPAYRVLRGLARAMLARSSLTVVLGPEMAARITPPAGGARPEAVRALPLWGTLADRPVAPADRLRAERGWGEGDTVLMYSGNMGLGHRFQDFLAAAERHRGDSTLRWVFAGGGPRRGEIEEFCRRHPEAPVTLQPGVSADRLRDHLALGNVHLASLDPAWQGCMLPSKVQGIFAVGRPVILVGGDDNSAARWIRESGGGWVVAPGDAAGLERALEEARVPLERERRGAAALAYAAGRFDRHVNGSMMCEWIEAAAAGRPLPDNV